MSGPLSRRELFALFRPGTAAASAAAPSVPPEWLPPYCRPPGAVEAAAFARLCDGCGDCIDACPETAILRLGPAYGSREGTPAVLPDSVPCRLCPEMPCAAACATGALVVVAPEAARLGVARWSAERCWAASGQPCDYCVTACPLPSPAVAIAGDQVRIDADRCTGCGLCAHFCTATPAALVIESAEADSPASV